MCSGDATFTLERPQPVLVRARPLLCRIVPAAAVLCFLAWCYVSARPDFSWDDADPEILNQAWRFARGMPIYRAIDSPPYAFAAYTPLYYAVTGTILRVTGLSFMPARLISLLSALLIGWALIRLDRHWNNSVRSGIWAGFFLLLVPAFLYNATRSHVQMMAVALSLWSFVFFLRNRPVATLIISPLLTVLAFYTKQTQVALPAAMVIYLAVRNRRWLPAYVAVGTIGGLIPLVLMRRDTLRLMFLDTVELARLKYTALQIAPVFLHFAGPVLLFLGVAAVIASKRFRRNHWEEIDLYFGCVLIMTVISLGRAGAHTQYVLELIVVVMVLLIRTTGLPVIRGKDALVSAQILFLLVYTPLFVSLEEGLFDVAANKAAIRIYPMLKTGSGPILSQQGSFALFGRGEIYVQLFHFSGLTRVGLWDQKPLLSDIDARKFSWVVTEFPLEEAPPSDTDDERFTPEIVDSLRQNYVRCTAVYPYYIYSPRSRGPGENRP